MSIFFIVIALVAAAAVILWWRSANSTERQAGADPAPAPPLHLGIKAYMREDYTRAEPILRLYAEAGELKAQQLLAKMYYSGHGVPQSNEQYLQWLQRAADQGDRSAKARLKAARKNRDG